MNLIYFELTKNRKVFLISTLVVSLVISISLLFYPLYNHYATSINNTLNLLPPKTLEGLGISLSGKGDILSYYTFFFPLYSFLLAIAASIIGLNVLSASKEEHQNDFYFRKPIKRKRILRIKILANLAWLILSFLIYVLISLILILILKRDSISIRLLLEIDLSLLLLELVFYFIGLLIGSFLRSPRRNIIIAMIIAISFKLISVFVSSFNLTILEYINPFSYFTVYDIIDAGKFQYRFLVITTFLVFFLYQFVGGIYENEEIGGDSLD